MTDTSDTSNSAGASERADAGPDKVSDNAPEIGQKIIYADNVPALLHGDLTLSPEEEARIPELQALFDDHPLKLAERGAEDWNLWVKATHARWLVRENRGDTLHVALKPTKGRPWDDDYFAKNGIDFTKGLTAGEDGLFDMPVSDFTGFIFPFLVSFKKASFGGNAWFSEASFGGDAGFGGASFGGDAGFGGASFGGDAGFEKASFGGNAGFGGAKFEAGSTYQRAVFFRGARWYDSEFAKSATWEEAVFWQQADFGNSRFRASVDLDHATFGQIKKGEPPEGYADWPELLRQAFDAAPLVGPNSETVPNFKGAEFVVPPDLGFTTVNVPPAPDFTPGGRGVAHRLFRPCLRFFGRYPESYQIKDSAAAAKLRRLQELADKGHHAYAEKRFFRAELLCRRGHEATAREIAMINAFELFSGCGLSFWRPLRWLAGLQVFSLLLYACQIPPVLGTLMVGQVIVLACIAVLCLWHPKYCAPPFALFFLLFYGVAGAEFADISAYTWGELWVYTGLNSLPIVGFASEGHGVAVDYLFDGAANIPFWVKIFSFVQNLLSAILLFFALLAIRNYFKLG